MVVGEVLASVLMNGICCVHSMHEEEARRKEHQDFLRKTIHVEMQRQRIIERDLLEQQFKERGLSDAAVVAEARRRLLMATKIQAKKQSCSVGSLEAGHDDHPGGACRYDECLQSYTMTTDYRQCRPRKSLVPPSSSMNSRISSAPVWCVRDAEIGVSSLMDDEDEEDEDLEEVSLRWV